MPAHITHELFAESAFTRVLNSEEQDALQKYRKYWVFGAQGPDFFLHNHRTQPSGLIFGKLLHNEGYGEYVSHLVGHANRAHMQIDSPLGSYIMGFVTHAILDRRAHPYINFFSGWVDRDKPESIRFNNCHPFLERIIDVLLLQMQLGINITHYDFFERVDLGDELPATLVEPLAAAIESTYSEYHNHKSIETRIGNAYIDTINFYRFSNPTDREGVHFAWHRDDGGSDPTRRFLALFHPNGLPELDYLNIKRAEWNHPGDPQETHNESFLDIFELALQDAERALRIAADALSDNASIGEVVNAVGNQNLSDGRTKKARRNLEFISPLPLDEVLMALYAHIGAEINQ